MKKKFSKIMLIVLFAAILYVPSIAWYASRGAWETPNLENRVLAEWPRLSEKKLEALPKAYEKYYNDHMPFRNQLIYGNSLFAKHVFRSSANANVIFGKDGWLFYNGVMDGDPIATYRGEDLLTGEELRQIVGDLRKTRDNLAKRGIEFVLLIAPNKERVYPEYMPDAYGPPAEEYAAKQLVDFLKSRTDLHVVYAYDDLMQAKAEFPDVLLYYPFDTHWNRVGAYVGARAVLRELGIEIPALTRESLTLKEGEFAGDLNVLSHLILQNFPYSWYEVKDANRPGYRQENSDNNLMHTAVSDLKTAPKLLMKHDSFGENLLPYVLPWFSSSHTMFNQLYANEMVEVDQPDVFVQVAVERYVRKWLMDGPLYVPTK